MAGLLFLPLLAGIMSAAGTAFLLVILHKYRVVDTPNERSNHKAPVPRGGGIAIVASLLLSLSLAGTPVALLCALILLAMISFMDDVSGLAPHWRLGVQAVAVILAMSTLDGRILPHWVPALLEWPLVFFGWLWIINLTNFMDGIDGITSMQTIAVMLGILLLGVFSVALPAPLLLEAAILAAAVLGFYWFNRHPARIFMGDVGSVPIGLLTGYLLFWLAAQGHLVAALILPAYYLSDATLTLLRRVLRGAKVWHAHSEHAYQQAARRGLTHYQVVCRITGLNLVLVMLALLSTASMMAAILCLIIAYSFTFLLLQQLTHAPLHQ